MSDHDTLLSRWQASWPDALALWSRYTQLRNPMLCETRLEASEQGLTDSFAMIRLKDQSVVVNMEAIRQYGLEDYALEILAHEIGHHILSPATLTDHARMIARMHVCLPTLENRAGMVANLYSDLLINNHLKRQFGLRIDGVYRKMDRGSTNSVVWQLYLRVYEHLWQLNEGALGGKSRSDAMEGDAWLGARIIKVYAADWLTGASRFASLLLPYLAEEKEIADQLAKLMDTQQAGNGQFPSGLVHREAGESDTIHPSSDPVLMGEDEAQEEANPAPEGAPSTKDHGGQYRDPFEYGEILKSAGIDLSDHQIAVRYYKERAMPLLIPFPSKRTPSKTDLIPEGTALWEPGEPIEDIDWFSTLSMSEHVIPGVTTVKREWDYDQGTEPEVEPFDLDLYVDCSGSMPNPQINISYTTLAGAILCLSALRAGAAVQVTLWSGPRQFKTTQGFELNEQRILTVLTDYLGGSTAFPIHILRQTYLESHRQKHSHIVILSDDGVTTLFDKDEQGNSGWDIAQAALERANGGGFMVLNLPWSYPSAPGNTWLAKYDDILKIAEQKQDWRIYPVSDWEAMIQFAKSFSQQHYQGGPNA